VVWGPGANYPRLPDWALYSECPPTAISMKAIIMKGTARVRIT
jgi:hypothetical protein